MISRSASAARRSCCCRAARPEMLVRSAGWGEGAVDHTRIDLRNLEHDDAEQMFKNLLARCNEIPDDTSRPRSR